MIDGTKQRKKHAINNKDRDGMLKYKPDYHDNKFTTNNELPGRDNKFALEAKKFKKMCELIRSADDSLTDLGDEPQESEIDIIKNYRGRWSKKS